VRLKVREVDAGNVELLKEMEFVSVMEGVREITKYLI
jgi:flavoprotein